MEVAKLCLFFASATNLKLSPILTFFSFLCTEKDVGVLEVEKSSLSVTFILHCSRRKLWCIFSPSKYHAATTPSSLFLSCE